jgi:hypothetical protein
MRDARGAVDVRWDIDVNANPDPGALRLPSSKPTSGPGVLDHGGGVAEVLVRSVPNDLWAIGVQATVGSDGLDVGRDDAWRRVVDFAVDSAPAVGFTADGSAWIVVRIFDGRYLALRRAPGETAFGERIDLGRGPENEGWARGPGFYSFGSDAFVFGVDPQHNAWAALWDPGSSSWGSFEPLGGPAFSRLGAVHGSSELYACTLGPDSCVRLKPWDSSSGWHGDWRRFDSQVLASAPAGMTFTGSFVGPRGRLLAIGVNGELMITAGP